MHSAELSRGASASCRVTIENISPHEPSNLALPGAPRSAFWYVGLGVLRSCFQCPVSKNKKGRNPGFRPKTSSIGYAGGRFELTTLVWPKGLRRSGPAHLSRRDTDLHVDYR